jgi:hypothetical protein
MYKVKGKIISIGDVQTGFSKAGKEWTKVDFAIQTLDEKYPKTISFSLMKEDQLDGHDVGSELEVTFTVESRDYNGKYYHNINAINLSRPKTDLPF